MSAEVPWTAPPVPDIDEPLVADERTMLEGWLAVQRRSLLHKCAGLTGEQLAIRSVPPSPLSLLGLIRHLTDVERIWFRRRMAGERVDSVYPGKDSCFHDVDPRRASDDHAALTAEGEACRSAVSDLTLDHTFAHPRYGEMSLRWVFLHVIREYAGHGGHADLLREQIDGVTFS